MRRLFFLSLTCALLAACGVKPSSPDAPDPHSVFPRAYPDIGTDPGGAR